MRFLIKLVAKLLVESSNLLTLNQCLYLRRSVDREIIFTLKPSASDTPVMSVGEIALLTKTEKMVRREQTGNESQNESLQKILGEWVIKHQQWLISLTPLRCWQTKGEDWKKRASYNRWLTEGHGWTLKDSMNSFWWQIREFGWVKTMTVLWIYPLLLLQTPILSYLPGSPIFFLPPALVLLGNQQF